MSSLCTKLRPSWPYSSMLASEQCLLSHVPFSSFIMLSQPFPQTQCIRPLCILKSSSLGCMQPNLLSQGRITYLLCNDHSCLHICSISHRNNPCPLHLLFYHLEFFLSKGAECPFLMRGELCCTEQKQQC